MTFLRVFKKEMIICSLKKLFPQECLRNSNSSTGSVLWQYLFLREMVIDCHLMFTKIVCTSSFKDSPTMQSHLQNTRKPTKFSHQLQREAAIFYHLVALKRSRCCHLVESEMALHNRFIVIKVMEINFKEMVPCHHRLVMK